MSSAVDVHETVRRYYAAARAGYSADAAEMLSKQPGVVVIGTDPDEWWNATEYNRAMAAQAEAMGGVIPIYEGEIQARREGDVAWFVDRPTFRFDDGIEAQARVTGVLQLEGADWKIVHLHVSFGVPNEEALGQELPV